jgi:formylglycine-generating enzyme required for sulfatase activity
MNRIAITLSSVLIPVLVCGAAERPAPPPPNVKATTDKVTIRGSTVEFTLVQLPAGKITLKDADGKDVEHAIKPIWIGQTEVTWPEYDNFWQILDVPDAKQASAMRTDKVAIRSRPSTPYSPPDRGWGHDGSPAGSMFGREAKAYCKWLSEKTGHTYRLPTEAEWEYACRAGAAGPVKPSKAELKDVAWYSNNSEDQTHPVAKKKPNAWGLYDMLGNVAEWVTMPDGSEAVAGGSFQDDAEDISSDHREPYSRKKWQKDDPQDPQGKSWLSNGGHVGFRLVREN